MDEISNKTLATLLVVAIVISLAGTFFAMRGVSQVTNIISGGATSAAGTAKVYINESVSITLTAAEVNFGSGFRNATVVTDDIECNLTSYQAKPDCWAESVPGSSYAPGDFTLENDGNVFVNVTIDANVSSDNYFNTTCETKTIIAGDQAYEWAGRPLTSAGCTTHGTLTQTNTTFNEKDSPQLLCTNLSADDSVDDFNISIVLRVPTGPSGQCSSDVTFQAARST